MIVGYAQYHFLQRSLLLDNINADYVRTARAKGLTKAQAVRKHALRTSLIPVATQVAFTIPTIFTGAILTERIFAWQGMGRYFLDTINNNDINGVVAVAAFGAVLTAIGPGAVCESAMSSSISSSRISFSLCANSSLINGTIV